MTTWDEVALGDHVDLLTGYPFKSAKFTTSPDSVRLLKGSVVSQADLDWGGSVGWPSCEASNYQKFELTIGDVVLAMDRPWLEAGLKYAWITADDIPCLLVQRVARLRGRNGLDTTFLRYIIGSQDFTNYIAPIVTGVNVPHISPRQICSFRFQLPPVPTQRKIAGILSAYDDLIENNNRRINLLEEMAQRIYREWFVDFRYPGHEKVPMVHSALGPIPQGWEWLPASQALTVNPTVAIDRLTEHPFVPMTSVSEHGMNISPINKRVGLSGAKFENGDTLFARITPCLENGKTAFVQCLRDSEIASGSTEFIVLRSRRLCPEYVYLLARDDRFRSHAIKSMSGASGRQRVREQCFDSFMLAVPTGEVLDSFVGIARPLFKLSYALFVANNVVSATRDLLLERLVSGELDVSGLTIEMPAAGA